jgi:hypothetical protein
VTIMDARHDAARTREEILDEIVRELKPWKRPSTSLSISAMDGSADLKNQTLVFRVMPVRPKSIRAAVEEEIDGLLEPIAQGRQPATETKKAARKLKTSLDALFETFNEIPANNVVAIRARCNDIPRLLHDLREFCLVMEREIPSKKTDITKRRCATTALRLIFLHSEKPPTATTGHPMREIASLLYEFVTGNFADTERACDACIRQMRERMDQGRQIRERMERQRRERMERQRRERMD